MGGALLLPQSICRHHSREWRPRALSEFILHYRYGKNFVSVCSRRCEPLYIRRVEIDRQDGPALCPVRELRSQPGEHRAAPAAQPALYYHPYAVFAVHTVNRRLERPENYCGNVTKLPAGKLAQLVRQQLSRHYRRPLVGRGNGQQHDIAERRKRQRPPQPYLACVKRVVILPAGKLYYIVLGIVRLYYRLAGLCPLPALPMTCVSMANVRSPAR